MKKIISMLMTASLVLGLSVPVMAGEMEDKLVILHTNDIHGHYEKAEGQIGIAGVAALKDQYEAQGAEVLLLDAGDFSQGTTLVNHNKGINAPEYLIAADYDAVCLGNHEFDYGNQAAKDIVSALNGGNIPVLTANILKKGTTEPFFGTNKIFEMEGVKVGVFGLDTAETQTKAAPSSVLDMTFVDGKEMFAIAQKQVNELKEAGCEYIIALWHLGLVDESIGRRCIELAEAVTGIDLIIDGHSHTEMDGGEIVKDTMIVSAGCYLANIGTVVVDKETKEEKAVLIGASDFAANYGVYDEAVAQMVEGDLEKVNEIYAEVFAKSEVDLNGERDPGVRNMETNLSNLITDAYLYTAREYVKKEGMDLTVDMAVVNGGGTRAGIPAGEISRNHIFTALPNRTTVVLMTVTGEQLLEALEASTFCTPMALGGFPQVSGMEYTLNTAIPYESGGQYPESTYYAPAKPGSRVTIRSIDGKPFDPNA
ncbi:MAG: bifunctional UDP-sugar hydrolase/5'-nucleotidase, partial [Bacillota bacterium]|nr:bifunctional UDP-sugar hydrolase/5'-nucleotidase [Bacillota bacterium]